MEDAKIEDKLPSIDSTTISRRRFAFLFLCQFSLIPWNLLLSLGFDYLWGPSNVRSLYLKLMWSDGKRNFNRPDDDDNDDGGGGDGGGGGDEGGGGDVM